MINFNFVNNSKDNKVLILNNNLTTVNLINFINFIILNNFSFLVNIILMFILINNLNIQIKTYHN